MKLEKYLHMKKITLLVLLAVLSTAVWADEPAKKPSCAGFVSNGFWDNWEISGGIGVGTAISNGKDMGSFGDRIGFEGNVSLLKWFHPVVGARVQLQGGRLINFDPSLGKEKWPYLFAHMDLTINVSNWIGGYRDDRAYYAVPFIGFGYMASNFTDKSKRDNHTGFRQNFAMAYGILNKFRISPAVDFNIELKGLLVPSRMSPAKMDGSYLFGFSATAGFTYRFNRRGWQRGVPGYSAEDIRAFQQAVADGNEALETVKAENARLSDDLKAARAAAEAAKAAAAAEAAKAAAAEAAAKQVEPSVILYDYGMAQLTSKEITRLELLAEKIKSGPKDRVYSIDGHADRQTGTSAANQRLSERRAKVVYDFLVSRGVNPDQLSYQGKGDKENPFPVQKANRAVVVE